MEKAVIAVGHGCFRRMKAMVRSGDTKELTAFSITKLWRGHGGGEEKSNV